MHVPANPSERSPLNAEIRHSAMLLGGALGLMSLLAVLMFFASRWLAA